MTQNGRIPFVDLLSPHRELESELLAVFKTALETAGFVGGPMVDEFEREYAQFFDAKFCVGVSSGTDALRFALLAAGVQAGDIVLTVPLTFIATTEAISQAGARPDFRERRGIPTPATARRSDRDEALCGACRRRTPRGRPGRRSRGRAVRAARRSNRECRR